MSCSLPGISFLLVTHQAELRSAARLSTKPPQSDFSRLTWEDNHTLVIATRGPLRGAETRPVDSFNNHPMRFFHEYTYIHTALNVMMHILLQFQLPRLHVLLQHLRLTRSQLGHERLGVVPATHFRQQFGSRVQIGQFHWVPTCQCMFQGMRKGNTLLGHRRPPRLAVVGGLEAPSLSIAAACF